MGKHDMTEVSPGINQGLEQHYKDMLKLKDAQLEEAKELMARAMETIDKMQVKLDEKDALIEQLEKALVRETIRATVAEGLNGR